MAGLGWLRSKTFSDAAVQFCLTIKCLFGLPMDVIATAYGSCLGYPPVTARCAAGKRAWSLRCTSVQATRDFTCWLTPQAPSSWAKPCAKPRSTLQSGAASGAKRICALMQILCRCRLSLGSPMKPVIHQWQSSYGRKFQALKQLPASQTIAHMTRRTCMKLCTDAEPFPSLHPQSKGARLAQKAGVHSSQ